MKAATKFIKAAREWSPTKGLAKRLLPENMAHTNVSVISERGETTPLPWIFLKLDQRRYLHAKICGEKNPAFTGYVLKARLTPDEARRLGNALIEHADMASAHRTREYESHFVI